MLEFVRGLHAMNAVLIVLVWLWVFGLLVVGLFRPLRLSASAALYVLTSALVVQVLLGITLFFLLNAQQLPAFHGHSGLNHMDSGLGATRFIILALWQNHQPSKSWLTTL